MVVAYLALLVALGGTGAYAANTVFSTDIVDGEVKTADIGTDQVQRPDIQNGAVVGNKIDGGAVTNGKLANNAVTSPKIADDSVGTSEIASSVVGADELKSVHEHFGSLTNITDVTAHDGSYSVSSQTVSCARGEPHTATVQVGYDGGATTASCQPVATCIS